MKKIILAMLTVLLVSAMIFGGCAAPAEEAPTTPTEPTEPAEPEVKPIEWRFASFIPPFDIYATETTDWADDLEEATGGRLKMSFYFAESFVKMAGLPDAIASGTADIGQAATAPFPGRFPLAQIFNLAMIFKHPRQAGQAAIAILNNNKAIQDEYYPMKVLWYQAPGPNDLVTTKYPVQTLEDLKGLKIGATGKTDLLAYELLGAAPVPILSGEAYQAMETGVCDGRGTDFNAAFVWKWHEVTKYRIGNIAMSHNTFPTLINVESYNELPEDIKEIFDELTDPVERGKRVNEAFEGFYNDSVEKVKEFDKTVGNPPIYHLPEAERERWREVVWPLNEDWVEEVEAKGLPGEAILADAIAFAKQYE